MKPLCALLWLLLVLTSLASAESASHSSDYSDSIPRNLRVSSGGSSYSSGSRGFHTSTKGNKCQSTTCYIALACSIPAAVILTL